MIAQCFTCTGSYALLILLGLKCVENRSMMPNPPRGRCAISCSKSFCLEEYENFLCWASNVLDPALSQQLPRWEALENWRGKIIGACDYAAYTRQEYAHMSSVLKSPSTGRLVWDEGYEYWWVLSNVTCFKTPIPCRGNVGMWNLPPALLPAISHADTL